jgi:hypothetical protein
MAKEIRGEESSNKKGGKGEFAVNSQDSLRQWPYGGGFPGCHKLKEGLKPLFKPFS